MKAYKLGLIGAGRMGHAIVASLVAQKKFLAREVFVAEPDGKARRRAARLGCRVSDCACEVSEKSRTILLAVKPQKIAEVAERIRPSVRNKRVISILAGATRARLLALLPGARIVRVMPNTPLLAGCGAVVIARDRVSRADLQFTIRLFSPLGRVWTAPEIWMNAVTALSGSGPALVAAFLEAYISAGRANGLPAAESEALAIQTLAGTSALLRGGFGLTPKTLREMVTSPGGTTEAALAIFERRKLGRIVREAFDAAVRRGRTLSR